MEETGNVLKLEKNDIRRISTSQVIANIGGACRELIDNALDAGATTIEIRTSEFGVKLLEVIDNGSGITSSNFNALCKPHSTSKLSTFEDFDRLLTFGFRGEALNALAALGDLTIITQHKSEPTATRMKFNQEGEIIQQFSCARQSGTTVVLADIFKRLPVRQKQFQATAKEQFQKLMSSVQAFALSRTDIRFIVRNTVGGKISQMLATSGGNATLKSVVTNLFGARSEKESMLEIKDAEPDNEILEAYGLPLLKAGDTVYDSIKIRGYVSSCEFGRGRSTTDRQFIFVNGRPVDYSKMCKVVNEVYSSFNRGHYCTLVCFVDLNPKFIDVNVTPDKRSVFLKIEKEVFAKLRACLLATFQAVVGQCPVSSVLQGTQTQIKFDQGRVEKENVATPKPNEISNSVFNKPLSTLLTLNRKTSGPKKISNATGTKVHDFSLAPDILTSNATTPVKPKTPTPSKTRKSKTPTSSKWKNSSSSKTSSNSKILPIQSKRPEKSMRTLEQLWVQAPKLSQQAENPQQQLEAFNFEEADLEPDLFSQLSSNKRYSKNAIRVDEINSLARIFGDDDDEPVEKRARPSEQVLSPIKRFEESSVSDTSAKIDLDMTTESMNPFDMTFSEQHNHTDHQDHACILPSKDMLETSEPREVEQNLSLMLKKEDFGKMEVVGQFNKAFILARLGQNLFIIDQHASDEKYNFERLQATHKLEYQRLFNPKSLEIGAIYEAVISENLEVFRANGFNFEFHENAEPGKRIMLVSIPVVHGYMFGESDIEEIAGVLNSYPGTMYRPEKIRKIFASWSCRSSVMIGKVLKKYEMARIVKNMGTIDNPWSCPHGRPTIRHLCELKFSLMLPKFLQLNNVEDGTPDESADKPVEPQDEVRTEPQLEVHVEPQVQFRSANSLLDYESQIF